MESLNKFINNDIDNIETEKVLKRSESNFKAIFNSGPQAILMVDKDYSIRTFNKKAVHMIEVYFNKALQVGNIIFDYFQENQIDGLRAHIANALKGEFINHERCIIGIDGLKHWFEVSYNPVLAENDEIIGVCFAAWYIGDRKKAEAAMTERLAFEKLVSGISSRFISFTDISEAIRISLKEIGQFTGADRVYIFEFTSDVEIMDNTYEWCVEGVSPEIDNLKGLPSNIFPWWMKKLKNDEIIYVKDVSKLLEEASQEKEILEMQNIKAVLVLPLYSQKKLIGFIGFDNVIESSDWSYTDLSLLRLTSEIFGNAFNRMRVENALRESEKKFRELFHNANDMISVHTLEDNGAKMRFAEVNDIACRNAGYTREEFLSLTPAEIYTPDFDPQVPELHKVIAQVGHVTYELNYIRKDGSTVPVEMNSHLFVLNGEKVVLSIGRDITERKKMEEELKRNNLELRKTIEKLKQTQSQLIQQEQLAAIGQLAAGIAHEINNPLGFVLSNSETLRQYISIFTEILESYRSLKNDVLELSLSKDIEYRYKSIADDEKKKQLDFVINDLNELLNDSEEGLHRVGNIVKGLRVFSRVDDYDEYGSYNINEGIKNTLLVAVNEYKYHIKIEENLGAVPEIRVIGGQINQVLLNIVLNSVYAIKAKNSSELGRITITTFKDVHCLYCTIEDNGVGISEENIGKVFNPFFTTKPVGSGTGLGLSIAYDIIVNNHGGILTVESTADVGTKFTIKLPIKS